LYNLRKIALKSKYINRVIVPIDKKNIIICHNCILLLAKIKKILITGCNGYIGSCICAFLSKKYFKVDVERDKLQVARYVKIESKENYNNWSWLRWTSISC